MRKSKIGFVFQKFNLLPTLSAIDNIDIAYDISGRKEPMDRAVPGEFDAIFWGLLGRLQHRPSELIGRRTAASGDCKGADHASCDCAGGRADGQSGYEEF